MRHDKLAVSSVAELSAVPRLRQAELSQRQTERYARHLILPEIGVEGQLKLRNAKVLLAGVGGLGSWSALCLAGAGVGTLGIVDYDTVDRSNVPRQVVHTPDRIGMSKVASAAQAIETVAPEVDVEMHKKRLSADNVRSIVGAHDVIVDCVDNFPTRSLLNDAAVCLGIGVVSAAVFEFEGQVSVTRAPPGPCYRCMYPAPPPRTVSPPCGVLSALPAVMGTLQAIEVVKLITGIGEPLIGRLLLYDSLRATFTELKIRPDPACPICSNPRYPRRRDAPRGACADSRWTVAERAERAAPAPPVKAG